MTDPRDRVVQAARSLVKECENLYPEISGGVWRAMLLMRDALELQGRAYRDGFNIANAETERLRTSIRKFTHEMLTSNDLGELATAIKESLMQDHAAALQSERAQGRREGLEEALQLADEMTNQRDLIRKLMTLAGMEKFERTTRCVLCRKEPRPDDGGMLCIKCRALAQETSDG